MMTAPHRSQEPRGFQGRLRATLAQPYPIEAVPHSIDGGGGAVFPDDARDPGELLRLADGRMYDVKRRRKREARQQLRAHPNPGVNPFPSLEPG